MVDPLQPDPKSRHHGHESQAKPSTVPASRSKSAKPESGDRDSVRARLLEMILQNEATRKPKPH